ncbi:MAG: RNA polymerase sigma factor [Bryobacteraceae bacterium]
MAAEKTTDNERLVLAIAAGNREAERSFVLEYLPKVRAMVLARTRNHESAADLVQDVMIEAICALRRGQLREAAKLSSYVLGIARNLLNLHFQNAARQPVSLESLDNPPDLAVAMDSSEEEEEQALARCAISSLDPVDRSILQLTLAEGLKPGAIAQRLRLSPDVVRQRKLRATRKVVDFVAKASQNISPPHFKKRDVP